MKKYILAVVAAITALAGPSVGAADAQTYFNRSGPTFIDRLMGNGYYNPYAGYAAYPTYNYPNYNYNFARRPGCGMYNRNPYGGGYYGAANPWANQMRRGYYHHHHHRRW